VPLHNDPVNEPRVRRSALADAAAIAALYAPVVEHTTASFELVAPDADEIARRMSAEPALPWLVAVDGDQVLGFAYAAPLRQRPAYRWSVETSVYVDSAYARRGIGRSLLTALLDQLAGGGHRMAFAGIALPNPASVRLHESLGFQPVGVFPNVGYKQGDWRDIGWWSRQLGPLVSDPAEPAGRPDPARLRWPEDSPARVAALRLAATGERIGRCARVPLGATLELLPLPATAEWPQGVWDAELARTDALFVEVFAPVGTDHQTPHEEDEVYVVVRGEATLVADDESVRVGPGDAIVVPAGAPHRFTDIGSEFCTWAVFCHTARTGGS
jgi:phosphinothricin acetyltransferase